MPLNIFPAVCLPIIPPTHLVGGHKGLRHIYHTVPGPHALLENLTDDAIAKLYCICTMYSEIRQKFSDSAAALPRQCYIVTKYSPITVNFAPSLHHALKGPCHEIFNLYQSKTSDK